MIDSENRGATFITGGVGRHIILMTSTGALSVLAVFLVDILTLLYVSLMHQPVLLAAIGISKIFIFFNSAISTSLVIAAATVISDRLGRNRVHSVARLNASLLLMTLLASGITAAVQIAFLEPLARWLGADDISYPIVHEFIWLTLPFTMLSSSMQMSSQILRTSGDSWRAFFVVLSGVAVLAVADPLLIFAAHLGVVGAGVSYALAAVTSASLGLYWVYRRVGIKWAISLNLLRIHAALTLKVALPAAVANLATPLALGYLFFTLSTAGTPALAALAVIDRVTQLAYCAFFSVPTALAPVLGQNIGARLENRVIQAIAFSRWLVVSIGLVIWIILISANQQIASLYELQDSGRQLLRAFCLVGAGFWVIVGLDFVAVAVFITMARPWRVAFFALLRATVGTIPFVLIGTHFFGAAGALPGMLAGNAVIAVISIITASAIARQFFKPPAKAT